MTMRRLIPLLLALVGCAAWVCAQDASITKDSDLYRIKAATYEATVAQDGCMESLRVNGVEFFMSAPSFPRTEHARF